MAGDGKHHGWRVAAQSSGAGGDGREADGGVKRNAGDLCGKWQVPRTVLSRWDDADRFEVLVPRDCGKRVLTLKRRAGSGQHAGLGRASERGAAQPQVRLGGALDV